jgi:hypothetical protein
MQIDEHFNRMRSLLASLECVLSAMEDVTPCQGASIFLMAELKDSIEACETALIEGEKIL